MSLEVRHIVASLDSATGGPAYSVPALSNALSELGCNSLVLSGKTSIDAIEEGAERVMFPGGTGGVSRLLQGAPQLRERLIQERSILDIVHTHGIWTLPNWYAHLDRNSYSHAKCVQAPRGMLSVEALAISKLRKKVVWRAIQKRVLETVHAFHVTAESELNDVRRQGFRQPAILVPNGIDIPLLPEKSGNDQRTLLFIGRVHPKKGLETLLRAWRELQIRLPNWQLKIVGPIENGYDAVLTRLINRLSLQRVHLEPPVYGTEKWREIANADLMILPSYTENFGNVVTEALACCVPVIATKGTPWSELETRKCGWWIERSEEDILRAVNLAADLSQDERKNMGARGRAWMTEAFGWDQMAQDMHAAYRWLLSGGVVPKCVIVD